MAGLVPYDAENITANWSSSAKQFSVAATALLPVPFVSAEFKRVDIMNKLGGRKFRLGRRQRRRSWSSQATTMQKPHIENDFTAPPRFPAISVTLLDLVKKTEPTVSINVTVDGPAPQPNFVRITAPMSDNTTPRSTVEGRVDGNAAFIWRAGELPGFVYWDVAWAGNGAGVGKADIFRATMTVAKGTLSGNASGQVDGTGSRAAVQPYAINLPDTRKDPVDLSDPDA